jgi:hypothetical protein
MQWDDISKIKKVACQFVVAVMNFKWKVLQLSPFFSIRGSFSNCSQEKIIWEISCLLCLSVECKHNGG